MRLYWKLSHFAMCSVVPHMYLTWETHVLIYEVALSRVEIIEGKCSKFIRKWLGLPNVTNNSALYRAKGALTKNHKLLSLVHYLLCNARVEDAPTEQGGRVGENNLRLF